MIEVWSLAALTGDRHRAVSWATWWWQKGLVKRYPTRVPCGLWNSQGSKVKARVVNSLGKCYFVFPYQLTPCPWFCLNSSPCAIVKLAAPVFCPKDLEIHHTFSVWVFRELTADDTFFANPRWLADVTSVGERHRLAAQSCDGFPALGSRMV